MPDCAKIAATLHRHLCEHDWHGYTQSNGRWGDGEGKCVVKIDGKDYVLEQGDRDCSSSVIECWQQAIKGTPYEGKLDAATYTGNMRQVFTSSGLFNWKPMTYVAARGDVYLNEASHTAMCQSQVPDMLSEFCINENGQTVGGAVGDQTGHESHVRAYYDPPSAPWDGFLQYNGKADGEAEGWSKDSKGWKYVRKGKEARNEWKKVKGLWYHFNNDGYAETGWRNLKNEWYYFNTKADGVECAMHTGWLQKSGRYYYLREKAESGHPDGSMVTGQKTLPCKFDSDGAMVVQ